MKDSQLSSLLTPILAQFTLELEEIDVLPAGKRRLLRIVVDGDGPTGRGPLLDDIAEATKAISVALDSSDALGNSPYTLEVSSRGVSRPLVAPRHWRRNAGRLVQVNLSDGTVVTGRIVASDDDGVDLDGTPPPGPAAQPSVRRIGYDEVAKAIVQVEFNRPTPELDESEEA